MTRSTTLQPGEELRGYRVKLYPTQEQLHYLGSVQLELMQAWNVLVTSRQTHVDHCVRHAEDAGLIATYNGSSTCPAMGPSEWLRGANPTATWWRFSEQRAHPRTQNGCAGPTRPRQNYDA